MKYRVLGMVLGAFVSFSAVAEDAVLVESGGLSITRGEFEMMIDVIAPPGTKQQLLTDEKRTREILADFFVAKMLADKAREQGLDKDEKFQFRQHFEAERALGQMYLHHAAAALTKPDFDKLARERYQGERERFTVPERVHAKHILVAVNEEQTDAQALEKATELLQRLKKGEDFATLAREHSDDPSVSQNEGDLGFFEKDRMVAEFSEAAFGMNKQGELAGPVRTSFGYHLIRFEAREAAGVRAFEQVKEQLVAEEQRRFDTEAKRKIVAELSTGEPVKANDDNIRQMLSSGSGGQ